MWKSAYHLFVLNGLIYLVTLLFYSLFLVISVPQIGCIKEPIFSYFDSVHYIKHMIHISRIMYKNVISEQYSVLCSVQTPDVCAFLHEMIYLDQSLLYRLLLKITVEFYITF